MVKEAFSSSDNSAGGNLLVETEGQVALPELKEVLVAIEQLTDKEVMSRLNPGEREQNITTVLSGIEVLKQALGVDEWVEGTLLAIQKLQDSGSELAALRELAHSVVAENVGQIAVLAEEWKKPEILQLAIAVVYRMATRFETGEAERKAGIDFLVCHFVQGIETAEESSYDFVALEMCRLGSKEQVEETLRVVRQAVDNQLTRRQGLAIAGFLGFGYWADDWRRKLITKRLIQPMVEGFGLDYDRLVEVWSLERGPVEQNLERMFLLEGERQGICRVLQKEFGIYHFDRYPQELLVDMYDNRDNTQLPYGVLFTPRFDHSLVLYNSGFKYGEFRDQLVEFYHQLRDIGYTLRIYEVGGKLSAGKAVWRIKQRYGVERMAGFVVIYMHGNSVRMVAGYDAQKVEEREEGLAAELDTRNSMFVLHKDDFGGKGVVRLMKGLVESGADVVVVSCLTGAKGGVAEKGLSRALPQARVAAPVEVTYLESLESRNLWGGRVRITPAFGSREGYRVFRNGRQIKRVVG